MKLTKEQEEAMKLVKGILADTFGIRADVLVLSVADNDGNCHISLEGEKHKLACVVNEVMSKAVAQMPLEMQAIMMEEIAKKPRSKAHGH